MAQVADPLSVRPSHIRQLSGTPAALAVSMARAACQGSATDLMRRSSRRPLAKQIEVPAVLGILGSHPENQPTQIDVLVPIQRPRSVVEIVSGDDLEETAHSARQASRSAAKSASEGGSKSSSGLSAVKKSNGTSRRSKFC